MKVIKKLYGVDTLEKLEQKLFLMGANAFENDVNSDLLYVYFNEAIKQVNNMEDDSGVLEDLIVYAGIFTIVLGKEQEHLNAIVEYLGQYKAVFFLNKTLRDGGFIEFLFDEYYRHKEKANYRAQQIDAEHSLNLLEDKLNELDLEDLERLAQEFKENTEAFKKELSR